MLSFGLQRNVLGRTICASEKEVQILGSGRLENEVLHDGVSCCKIELLVLRFNRTQQQVYSEHILVHAVA